MPYRPLGKIYQKMSIRNSSLRSSSLVGRLGNRWDASHYTSITFHKCYGRRILSFCKFIKVIYFRIHLFLDRIFIIAKLHHLCGWWFRWSRTWPCFLSWWFQWILFFWMPWKLTRYKYNPYNVILYLFHRVIIDCTVVAYFDLGTKRGAWSYADPVILKTPKQNSKGILNMKFAPDKLRICSNFYGVVAFQVDGMPSKSMLPFWTRMHEHFN